jgi:hypothetical protein
MTAKANLLRTQVGLMPSSFTFYNSWWRNLAQMLLCGFLAPLAILTCYFAFRDGGAPLLVKFGAVVFGIVMIVATPVFGFQLFDRRLKVTIGTEGVCDYRNSFGNIPWSEISDFRLWSLKGNVIVRLILRSPETRRAWMARANVINRFLGSLKGSESSEINIPLKNMAVKRDELGAFMTYMIAQASVRGKPCAQSAENTS